MKNNFFKYIIYIFTIFFLSIFWLGLKKDSNYNTKNLTGSRVSNFQLQSINSKGLISAETLKKNKFTLINANFANYNKNLDTYRKKLFFEKNFEKFQQDLSIISKSIK